MMNFDLREVGDNVLFLIKNAPWFPYKTGHLKFDATSGNLINEQTYRIHFDDKIAPYVEFLEEGSRPHDIPNAFGFGYEFGIGGRFDGKFHPGSTKHKGFIKEKSVKAIVEYIANKYNGEVSIV